MSTSDSRIKVDFIGIGSGKSGSTWLYDNIVKHPEICDRNLKELNYFSDLYDEHPITWYESQFKDCGPQLLKGEFSVTYITHPLAAARIQAHFPEVKLLAIVRDPVKRTFSNYLHSLRKGDIAKTLTFGKFIDDEENLKPARYVDALAEYYARFSREQILVLVLEDFLRDLPAGYREVFSFLGVADVHFLPPGYDARRNEARAYRFLWLENLLVRSYRWLSRNGYTRLVKRIVDSGIATVVRRLNASDTALPELDAASRRRLQEYYRPINRQLADLLGRDLSVWD
jgi:hypothetical protein